MVPIFMKRNGAKVAMLIVYVDDIVVTKNDEKRIIALKAYLGKEIEINDLGELRYFLGNEVERSKNGIVISQCKYTLGQLEETGKLGAKLVDTPIEQNHRLHFTSGELLHNQSAHKRLVGRLIYLTNTRPDISPIVSLLSQFMHAPRTDH